MKLLLDTCAVLWWVNGDTALSRQARAMIESQDNDVLVSIASLWAILVKVRSGKLDANLQNIEQSIASDGFVRLAVTSSHLRTLESLPKFHRDPFDHLLIAQAISEDAILVSNDHEIKRYPVRLVGRG